ncbi:MAG: hypothetical protein VX346_26675 [Planctomycetota bacterium]|nr:hypothetical protein [Planctomycetota bacterium]
MRIGVLIALAFGLVTAAVGVPSEPVNDTTFPGGDPTAFSPRGWRWDAVRAPSAARVDETRGTITLRGGRTFLSSVPFSVKPEKLYRIAIQAAGTGKVALECLWWTAAGLPASPHRSLVSAVRAVNRRGERMGGVVEAPVTAQTGQVRIIVMDGVMVLRSAGVRATTEKLPAGHLLLALDAAQPGDQAPASWRDLTGRNVDLKSHGDPVLNTATKAFQFDGQDDYFSGSSRDANRFNFVTEVEAGLGNGTPFTVVVYARLSGRSASATVTKLADVKTVGWLVGVDLDEFGGSRINAAQQVDNQFNRSIARFPGGAESPTASLGLDDGRFHLVVVHFSGTGDARSTRSYLDGAVQHISNDPWPSGNLHAGSVRTDAPLRIGGGVPSMTMPFQGEIGFIEIWRGERLLDGMSCSQYGRFRWNGGKPLRGRITQ